MNFLEFKADLRDELLLTIQAAQIMAPRSQQQVIGPSELGTPCTRKLAYKLAQHPAAADVEQSWRATVGTAVHAWLEEVFGRVLLPDGEPRYLVEQRVCVGQIGGQDIYGTADLYDKATCTVIDWKVPGPSSLKRMRARGVGDTYRVQRNLYGLGVAIAGHRVEYVANALLPSAGDLSDAVLDVEPFTPLIAIDALKRANAIADATNLVGLAAVLDGTTAVDDYCRSCPWLRRGSEDLTTGCPGVTPSSSDTTRQLSGLIA